MASNDVIALTCCWLVVAWPPSSGTTSTTRGGVPDKARCQDTMAGTAHVAASLASTQAIRVVPSATLISTCGPTSNTGPSVFRNTSCTTPPNNAAVRGRRADVVITSTDSGRPATCWRSPRAMSLSTMTFHVALQLENRAARRSSSQLSASAGIPGLLTVTSSTAIGPLEASASTTGSARSPSSPRSKATTNVLNMAPPIDRPTSGCATRVRPHRAVGPAPAGITHDRRGPA